MRYMRVTPAIELIAEVRIISETIRRGRSSSVRVRKRAVIILLAGNGLENIEIADQLGQEKMKEKRRRRQYAQSGSSTKTVELSIWNYREMMAP